MRKFKGETALLVTTLIWGGTFVIIKDALQDVSPMMFVAIRFTFAAVILLPFIFKIFKKTTKAALLSGLLLGLFYFLGFASQTAGLNYTTATKSAFITGTFVLFTPVFQLIFEKKIPGLNNVLGIILVLLGLIFLSSSQSSVGNLFKELGSSFNLGDFLTLLCAMFFAMYLVILDIVSKKHEYLPLVFIQISLTGILGILMVVVAYFWGFDEIKFVYSSRILFAFIYTSVFATIVASVLQTKYQKLLVPAKAGIILSFEPIFAAFFAYLILGETISYFGFLGCIFIFTGLLVSELMDNKKKKNVVE